MENKYEVTQSLKFKGEVYHTNEMIQIQLEKDIIKIIGRIDKFDMFGNGNQSVLYLDISEKYHSNKEIIFLDRIKSIERIKESE